MSKGDCRLYLRGSIGVLGAEAMVEDVVKAKKLRIYRQDVYNKFSAKYAEIKEVASVSTHKFHVVDPDEEGFVFVSMSISGIEGDKKDSMALPDGYSIFDKDVEKRLLDIAMPGQTQPCTVLVASHKAADIMKSVADIYGGVYIDDVADPKPVAYKPQKDWTSEAVGKAMKNDIADAVDVILQRYGLEGKLRRNILHDIVTVSQSAIENTVPDIAQAAPSIQLTR